MTRCPNGTRRVGNTCQGSIRKRCPNGTRRNKEGVCVTPMRSRLIRPDTPDSDYRGRTLQTTGSSEHFVALCKKHILNNNLASVWEKAWLRNGDRHIFLIGETHQPYKNTKCTPILEMFKALLKENMKSHPVMMDIMIEYLEYGTNFELSSALKNSQMSRVREFLVPCMKTRNCSARVHWTDPTQINSKLLPKWLQLLGSENYYEHMFTDKWKEHPEIVAEITTKKDIIKLLTENPIVMKEMEKANKNHPNFIEYAFMFFIETFKNQVQHAKGKWENCVLLQSRRVMDFYTCARIVKGDMKHMIIYAGQSHTNFMLRFLGVCGFTVEEYIKGTCI
jgi:hypothetical protein